MGLPPLPPLPLPLNSPPFTTHKPYTGTELETLKKEQLVEWFAENYKTFGTNLEFVTNRSQEGSQFCRGFGGIGGILRWKVDFSEIEMAEELDQVTTSTTTLTSTAPRPTQPHTRSPSVLKTI